MGSRVLVLCAEIGQGHLSTARALTASLRSQRDVAAVALHTDLSVMGPGMGRFMERGFRTHLGEGRSTYELAYRIFFQHQLPRRAGQLALALLGGRGLLGTIAGFRADVVVTEYPVLSAALGELRLMRRLPVPVCSAISDPAGLYYWAHPGVDMHLLNWPESLPEVERIAGPGKSVVVRPQVDSRYFEPLDRTSARVQLGLPLDSPVVAVSGGGWGMGDLVGAVATAQALPGEVTVVALAGNSEPTRAGLAGAFSSDPSVRVLGFTHQMPDLLKAADVLVHTTGGTTALEARVVGCPLINYGTDVAHVRAQADALAALGLAQWAVDRTALAAALRQALAAGRRPPMELAGLPDSADVVAGMARR